MKWLNRLLDTYWLPTPPQTRRVVIGVFAGSTVLVVALLTTSNQTGSIDFPKPQWQTEVGGDASATAVALPADSALTEGLTLTVHLIGEVKTPGIYQLQSPARVYDAIALAGGFTKRADQGSLNLARLLNDGEQVQILAIGENNGFPNASSGATALVNINRASVAELDTLPGIGPTLAARIVDFRTSNGGFGSVQDLGKVAGVGSKLLANLTPLVTL